MTDGIPTRIRRLGRQLYSREPTIRPPRTGTSREDARTFVILLVVATTISVSGVAYAFWAYG